MLISCNIGLMDLTQEPDFCVLIPVFNNPEGLIKSLKTIVYSKGAYLVVIIDDGSREPLTPEILEVGGVLSPFHLIRLPQNKGITEALNTGLAWIRAHTQARYIARLDCGDTCHPDRFPQQVAYLDAHPDVGLLGTWCTFRSDDGAISYPYTTPTHHQAILKEMHLRNVFIHPTVMVRTALLRQVGVYPYEYPHAEDYALFWSLLKVARGAVLDRFLVTCAFSQSGISMGNRKVQLKSRIKVVRRYGTLPLMQVLGLIKMKLFLFVPPQVILWLKKVKHKK
jgi:glycosyltransferase involved in cell wall biosynthesis